METPILDRPIPESSAPWPLSAPESYVLLHGPRAKGVEAFKRGLLELVARDVLTVETRDRRGLLRDSGGGDWGWSDGDGGSGWGDGDGGGGWGDSGGGGD
jgi:hypothetical protein